jgi:peptidyl-prolyl cis-trans isomerase SDCCAG10
MSSHYNTEPPPTASATLNTTVGPLHISLFAKQAPLACKNFLQHCLDGYYIGTAFHRVVPGFIIQGGDPTGTGSGGSSIYEDPEFEYDPEARDPNEKVVFGDELHSRLRFNRRGLVGMAKSEDGTYGSQFFITLGNAERELNGQCTLFGRIEGDSIYNVVTIAEAELAEGTDRPVYAVRVTGCEAGELGPFAGKLKKRQKVAVAEAEKAPTIKKKKKGKGGKTLLSFGGDEEAEGDDAVVKTSKPKFNTKLVSAGETLDLEPKQEEKRVSPDKPRKRPRSPSPCRRHSPEDRRTRPKTPDPYAQVPPKDPEVPERSPSPTPPRSSPKRSALDRMNAEIAAVKASMRRNVATEQVETGRKKSALEAMIPENSIRGRRRPPPGSIGAKTQGPIGRGGTTGEGFSSGADAEALKLFNAFKAKLESADAKPASRRTSREEEPQRNGTKTEEEAEAEAEQDEEAQLCDLHFIANCQSCRSWEDPNPEATENTNEALLDADWMTHQLRFGKDTLGKDLNWRKGHEDTDSLMVIDPRAKEKEIVGSRRRERERERDRKRETAGDREWDRR